MTSIPENRKNQKLLKMQRKSKKTPDMDKIIELKKMWEKIRPKNLSKAEKHALITKTFKMVDGNIKSLIFKHDSSRIVQALLKYSDPNLERRHILEQLSGNYVELSQTTYGKFIALKALKYAPNSSERSKIIQEFLNSKLLVKLFQHKFSGQVLDTIFCIYANGKERQRMLQEFYGTEYALTLATGTDDKNVPLSNISEVFAKFPEKKPRILSQMQSVLEGVLKKESIGPNEIIHR